MTIVRVLDDDLGDVRIKLDDLTLRVAAFGKENLIQIRDSELASFYFDLLFLWHAYKAVTAAE